MEAQAFQASWPCCLKKTSRGHHGKFAQTRSFRFIQAEVQTTRLASNQPFVDDQSHQAHRPVQAPARHAPRSEEHTSELQSRENLVCRLLLEKKKKKEESR